MTPQLSGHTVFDLQLRLHTKLRHMASQSQLQQRTIVFVPFAAQGHVAPMLQLARALADCGDVSVTVVVPDFIHRRMGRYRGDAGAGVVLAPIPSGVEDNGGNEPPGAAAIVHAMEHHMPSQLEGMLKTMQGVSCLVVDLLASWAIPVAARCGLPVVGFWVGMVATYRAVAVIPELIRKGFVSGSGTLLSTNGIDEDTVIQHHDLGDLHVLPEKLKLRAKDLPWLVSGAVSQKSRFAFWLQIVNRAKSLRSIIVNSFPGEDGGDDSDGCCSLQDVAYKPVEQYVETRKCEPDAGSDVVGSCERLWNGSGSIIEHTEPVCCPCGHNRVSTSCGDFFDKTFKAKGKRNTAHCVRFPGEWFHVFEIGKWSLGFSIIVHVKKSSSVSEVVVSANNRTVISGDNFLRVNLVGDYAGYTSIPSFDNFYLVTPRKEGASSGAPQAIDSEYSRWMLLDRFHFTETGLECDKIGVGYEAFQKQPNFCWSSFGSCLNNQLWNFLEGDQNRVNKSQPPQFIVEGRFQRINQHPDAGVHSFSVGVAEVLNTNLLVELKADDIEYVYQRSPGKIISIEVPIFEALSQVGTANITVQNTGKLEASYCLTFDCSRGINRVEEQFFIMKPDEIIIRLFNLHTSTDQAAKYHCTAILKASDFAEVDRKECEVSTLDTVLNNGTQIGTSGDQDKKAGTAGLWSSIKAFWLKIWDGVIDFFIGRLSRTKCSSFYDLICHLKYPWIGWVLQFLLLLGAVLIVGVIPWIMHQKGYFDPLYDWLEDLFRLGSHERRHMKNKKSHHYRHSHHHHMHDEHPQSHHAHQRLLHKSGPSYPQHHHRVLHRQDEQQPAVMAGGHRRRHNPALGVQHRDRKKHLHEKAMAVWDE